MDCSTKNIIYLISCKKCGVQYIGKTSQTLRSHFNNHRARLKQMCDIFLYNHFNSDYHSIDDVTILPIEEVTIEPEDQMSLADKLSSREEFWYRELCSVYPYGLNDNVYKVGNISRLWGHGIIVYNKHHRKYDVGYLLWMSEVDWKVCW